MRGLDLRTKNKMPRHILNNWRSNPAFKHWSLATTHGEFCLSYHENHWCYMTGPSLPPPDLLTTVRHRTTHRRSDPAHPKSAARGTELPPPQARCVSEFGPTLGKTPEPRNRVFSPACTSRPDLVWSPPFLVSQFVEGEVEADTDSFLGKWWHRSKIGCLSPVFYSTPR